MEHANANEEKKAAPSSKTGGLSRRLMEALAGSAVGFVLWNIFGPGLIGWWYEPPTKEAFSCHLPVRDAVGKFVTMQAVCALVGALLAAVVLFFGRRWWNRRLERAAREGAAQAKAQPPAS